ncbi:4-hydroxyphenylacetate decarboxylase activating enzyme [Saccharicrinis fermentans DSM 9555 = JCM 21142]|uniref:4-hydroxyphenylacetate decarboxylase activating enzyme n=2 Tax=Saccharicrinis fermentans TaxID=982 RepID=W7YSM9_9BACT|nr:4-hydroxyphenylacetate decarboxylase activating enzyme [Saccharicrinis fermentans DSM 9555 = JCM 21142]
MRCKWCHNPETFSSKCELEWVSDKCTNCQACISECKTGALKVVNNKIAFDKSKCNNCFACIEVCYSEALHQIGRTVSSEELYKEIAIDIPYFEESGGGITLSGGEPLFQFDFVKEILVHLKQKGIHTAMETNLSYRWDLYKELLPNLDYVMADFKLFYSDIHKIWTGLKNSRIIENIIHLDQTGIPYELRTPVIPGVNDSHEMIEKMAQFVSSLNNAKSYTLLPYHPLGATKYKNLGINNPMEGVKEIPKSNFKELELVKNRIVNV